MRNDNLANISLTVLNTFNVQMSSLPCSARMLASDEFCAKNQGVDTALKAHKIPRYTHIFAYDSVESTNDLAKEAAELSLPEGTVFVAEEQTNGKSRMARRWISPRGASLPFSIILTPTCESNQLVALPLLTSVALLRALKELGIKDELIALKWPNDVYLNSRKVAGILVERCNSQKSCVVGIGLNIDRALFEANADKSKIDQIQQAVGKGKFIPGFLSDVLAEVPSYEKVFSTVLSQFFKTYDEWLSSLDSNTEPFDAFLAEYLDHFWLIDKMILVKDVSGTLLAQGTVRGVTGFGILLLEDENCIIKQVSSGEIYLV